MNGLDTFVSHTLHFTNSPIDLFGGTSHPPPISLICPFKLFQTISQYIRINIITYMSSTCCWLSEILINWYIKRHQLSRPQRLSSPSDPQNNVYIYIHIIIFMYTYKRIVYEPDNKKIHNRIICSTPKNNHHQLSAYMILPSPSRPHPGLLPLPPSVPPTWPRTRRPPPRRPPQIPSPGGWGRWRLDVGGLASCFWEWTVLSTWKGYRIPQKMV